MIFLLVLLIYIIGMVLILHGSGRNVQNDIYMFLLGRANKSQLTDAEKVESTILSTGLTVIALAISVWAGLNITNAIERKELNELSDKVNKVSRQSRALAGALKENNNFYKQVFIRELWKLNNDETAKYFASQFDQIDIEDVLYIDLVKIEQLFGTIYYLHTVGNVDGQTIIEKANNGKEMIEGLHKELEKKMVSNNILELYLDYRIAVLAFYKGYQCSEEDLYHCFIAAAQGFMDCVDGFNVKLPEYHDDTFEIIPDYSGDMSTLRRAIFMANSIGEAYSKITEQFPTLLKKAAVDGFRIKEQELKRCARQAIFYCGCAVKWEADDTKKRREVYYRNLGCAYERYDRIFRHGQIGMSMDHKAKIVENYLEAFHHVLDDDSTSNKRVRMVYHVILSYLERCFKREILGSQNENDHMILDNEEKLIQCIQGLKDRGVSEENLKFLHKYRIISEIAACDNARRVVIYDFRGFAYTYIVLLILAGNRNIIDDFGNDATCYLQKIKENLEHLNVVRDRDDDYTKDLRNRYHLLKNYIENASNNKI